MTVQFPLLQLPDELIALVIEQVADCEILKCFARSCQRLRSIAEHCLYRKILLRSAARTISVAKSLKLRQARAHALRTLDVACLGGEDQNFDAVGQILKRSSNLRELMFEGPACNTGNFEDEDRWEQMTTPLFAPFQDAYERVPGPQLSERPLQNLQKFTLHLNGPESPYWTLSRDSIAIFLHPTLKQLKISCMNLPEDVSKFLPKETRCCTALKDLILEECNITPSGLEAILSIPAALETLYLGENCHNIRHFRRSPVPASCNHLFVRSPKRTVAALEQQKQSLQVLTYVTRSDSIGEHLSPRASACIDGGFSDFRRLKEVTLIGACSAFEQCLVSMSSPPNLLRLAVKDDVLNFNPLAFLRAPSASVPKSLDLFDITWTSGDNRGVAIPVFVEALARSGLVDKALKTASEVGIKLRVFANSGNGTANCYPPLLYGEEQSYEQLVYDGGFLQATKQ